MKSNGHWGIVVSVLAALPGSAMAADEVVSFNRDVRPILSDNCFQCHGPDERQRKAKLRFDLSDGPLRPAESGARAIAPHRPAESELLARITSPDAAVHMPPKESGKQLTAKQVDVLRRWIAQGAAYEGHWAFVAPRRPPVPAGTVHPVDAFVRARLEQAGLRPAPSAGKETLIRRATLDLTGLPPTPAEIDAFLADSSPQAYERVVDRLLASPRYGEHMAQQWLDFARYADSNGYQVDSSRQQWPWRDWVVRAFNDDLPFDRFTVEQMAGDLLPDATPDQKVATGFHRNHRLNGEGGIIAEEWRVETVIDRVETTGLTWLALTLNCCRCHDHKYDPITQREFYGLFAFFNNVPESGTLQGEARNTDPVVQVETAEQRAELESLDKEIAAAERRAAEADREVPRLLAEWEPKFRAELDREATVWSELVPSAVKSLGGATFERLEDGSYLAGGTNPARDTYEIVAPLAEGKFGGLLLECLTHPSLPEQSLGRFSNGNFVLTAVEARIDVAGRDPVAVKFAKAAADHSQKGWEIVLVLSGKEGKGWAVDGPTRKETRRAMFLPEAPVDVPTGATLTVRLRHAGLDRHNIGRFRLSTTSLPPTAATLTGSQHPESLRRAIRLPAAQRSPAQQAEIERHFRAVVDGPHKTAAKVVDEAKKRRAQVAAKSPTVMVLREGPPRDAFVLIRGQYDRRGDKVTAGVPAALPPLPSGAPVDRLALARWIVDRSNPLTARVWVNRAWERLFGTGLVRTTENLGLQSEWPSHPELLDWLAVEFMEPTAKIGGATNGGATNGGATNGGGAARPAPVPWSMKALWKLLVTSETYRQSSRVTPELAERDPENRLLARGPRFRLSAEVLRDQALAASGLLVDRIGGPSVRPYMPEGIWDETSRYGDLRNYQADKGEGLHRRSLYTIWKRTAAPPGMLLFDAPNREICTIKRSRTNTPLQALSLLNETGFVEAARKLAERMLREGGPTPADRIAYGFRLCTGRRPNPAELRVLTAGLEEDLARQRARPDTGEALLKVGAAPPDAGLDRHELAGYVLTANVLLNLDETLTRE